jgi:hypothetical protein
VVLKQTAPFYAFILRRTMIHARAPVFAFADPGVCSRAFSSPLDAPCLSRDG